MKPVLKKVGKSSRPEHFKSLCAAVLCHFSLHFLTRGVLLFYIKLLVRNYYYFYMSDHINAVYSNMYPVVIICARKWVAKPLTNHQNVDVMPSKWLHKIFQGATNHHRNYLNAYEVKGQIWHDALLVSLSGKSRCVALQSLTSDANIPQKGPA